MGVSSKLLDKKWVEWFTHSYPTGCNMPDDTKVVPYILTESHFDFGSNRSSQTWTIGMAEAERFVTLPVYVRISSDLTIQCRAGEYFWAQAYVPSELSVEAMTRGTLGFLQMCQHRLVNALAREPLFRPDRERYANQQILNRLRHDLVYLADAQDLCDTPRAAHAVLNQYRDIPPSCSLYFGKHSFLPDNRSVTGRMIVEAMKEGGTDTHVWANAAAIHADWLEEQGETDQRQLTILRSGMYPQPWEFGP